MSFSKLIINNVVRSARTYGSYFLSSVFSVFVFFIFAMLRFHPQLVGGLTGSSEQVTHLAQVGMGASQVLIVLLSLIFLWYSFWNFVKTRKHDLGIYLMLGMRPNDLRKLLFGENMLIGATATVGGVCCGVLFSKAILIILQKILKLTNGLAFYWPTKAIILTLVVFLIVFLLVSLAMTVKIETANLNQLGKSDEMPRPQPRTRWYWVLLGVLSLAGGYGSLVYFVTKQPKFALLLSCVLLTVLGTFLFFHQISVYFLKWCQTRKFYLRGTALLKVAEGIYRAKENATMYALITCTAAVALVGIGVTATLGSSETASRNSPSVAYIFDGWASDDPAAEQNSAVNQTMEQVEKMITDAGYQAVSADLKLESVKVPIGGVDETGEPLGTYNYLVSATDYNQLAQQLDLPQMQPKADQILRPVTWQADYERVKKLSADQRNQTIELELAGEKYPVTFTDVATKVRLASTLNFAVADPALYQKIAEINHQAEDYQLDGTDRLRVVDFKEWKTDPQLSTRIDAYLTKQREKYHEMEEKAEEDSAELSDKERGEQFQAVYQKYYIEFESRYGTWQGQRQSNALILIIGVLLGSVFFIFAASISYFRLFGDLDQAGRYHRSLYQLGLEPRLRHRIVTEQMLVMYFVPALVACVHFAVAFWGIGQLAAINLWHYYWLIVVIYLGMQLIFFIVSRWRYLAHLDARAENPQAF